MVRKIVRLLYHTVYHNKSSFDQKTVTVFLPAQLSANSYHTVLNFGNMISHEATESGRPNQSQPFFFNHASMSLILKTVHLSEMPTDNAPTSHCHQVYRLNLYGHIYGHTCYGHTRHLRGKHCSRTLEKSALSH